MYHDFLHAGAPLHTDGAPFSSTPAPQTSWVCHWIFISFFVEKWRLLHDNDKAIFQPQPCELLITFDQWSDDSNQEQKTLGSFRNTRIKKKKKKHTQQIIVIQTTTYHTSAEKKKKERKIRTSSSPVSPQERQRLGESGGGRRCFAVKPHQRCLEATSSHSLSSGSRTHARTFAHARTHRGGDGALHHAGELMIWNLLHKRTCDGSPTCRVLPLLVLLFLRRLISGRLALLRVSDRGVLMRILRQWWRTRPKTGRFSISKLWWVSDEVIDGVWRHVSAHDGIFFFFYGCRCRAGEDAAAGCSSASCVRTGGGCVWLLSSILTCCLYWLCFSIFVLLPFLHLDPQVLRHSQPLAWPHLRN